MLLYPYTLALMRYEVLEWAVISSRQDGNVHTSTQRYFDGMVIDFVLVC